MCDVESRPGFFKAVSGAQGSMKLESAKVPSGVLNAEEAGSWTKLESSRLRGSVLKSSEVGDLILEAESSELQCSEV